MTHEPRPDDWYLKALEEKQAKQIQALLWEYRRRQIFQFVKFCAFVAVIIAAIKYLW